MRASRIILGTVQMGIKYGINNHSDKISPDESHLIFQKAYKAGIRSLDTAESYGNAHEVIGSYNRSMPDQKFRIVTKVSSDTEDDEIRQKVERFCKELATDKLDALMFHSFASYQKNSKNPHLLRTLKDDGLIDGLGVSVYTNDEFARVLGDPDIDLIQIPFNLLDNYSRKGDLLKRAKKMGKIIHTRSAFLQGLFFKDPFDSNRVVQGLKDELLAIHEVAKDSKISMTELSLGYCLHQNEIDQVLIGVDSISHLDENIKASQYEIDEMTVRKINKINTVNSNWLNPTVWNQ